MLDAPATTRARRSTGPRSPLDAAASRRELSEDYARRAYTAKLSGRGDEGEGEREPRAVRSVVRKRPPGLRFRLRGGVPRSVLGRVIASGVMVAGLIAFTFGLWQAWTFLLHDPRLIIQSSESIQIAGSTHTTRPQLLSIFGDDVDRNLLTMSISERRAQLESLPWVEHATVMRLLPNRVRVAIVERTPVAFIRERGHIELVDGGGVILDMNPEHSPDTAVGATYSFPVVTGISMDDPLSTRAARMKLFTRFTSELDGVGSSAETTSKELSEVDLSNPEDVKALIPSGSSDILVHFGEEDFAGRYQRYKQNLPGWKNQYPKLASVDMRYEHQVVLEMQAGTSVPVTEQTAEGSVAADPAKGRTKRAAASQSAKKAAGSSSKHVAKPGSTAASLKDRTGHLMARKAGVPEHLQGRRHLQTAFAIHPKQGDEATKSRNSQAGPQ